MAGANNGGGWQKPLVDEKKRQNLTNEDIQKVVLSRGNRIGLKRVGFVLTGKIDRSIEEVALVADALGMGVTLHFKKRS